MNHRSTAFNSVLGSGVGIVSSHTPVAAPTRMPTRIVNPHKTKPTGMPYKVKESDTNRPETIKPMTPPITAPAFIICVFSKGFKTKSS